MKTRKKWKVSRKGTSREYFKVTDYLTRLKENFVKKRLSCNVLYEARRNNHKKIVRVIYEFLNQDFSLYCLRFFCFG